MKTCIMVLILAACVGTVRTETLTTDICIYGGTSGGVTAAVQAAKMGKSVVLISDYGHLGGLSSSGLGETDIGDIRIFGGLSKEFYQRLTVHYHGGTLSESTALTTRFEPHVAEGVFDQMVAEQAGITVIDGLLDLDNGVTMSGNRITALHLEDGTSVEAAMFIDACYEGDLMALAGVSFTIGREANAQYVETGNGNRGPGGLNQIPNGVDPYVIPGDPSSGLLPGINPDQGVATGEADHRLQAYCYRMCLTDDPANRVAVTQPAGYDEADYELLFRAIEAGQTNRFWKTSTMPNRKTDSNNDNGVSTDYIGKNYSELPPDDPNYWDWSTLNHAERAALAAEHRDWQLGLIWSVQNHPRVPATIRNAWSKWGLPADEFTDNNHWPYNLYVREARRMVSDYVMTEHNALGTITVPDSVGMGAYTLDSHHTQRIVSNGQVKNEGDIQKTVPEPYRISYRSIVPAVGECENLLVPWCTSSSHIAFGSIRMEPVFMVLGQSAATAASMAIDADLSVQEVDYAQLSQRLLADDQVLTLGGFTSPGVSVISSITSSEGLPVNATDPAGMVQSITVGETTYSELTAPVYLSSSDSVDFVSISTPVPADITGALGSLHLDTGTLNFDFTVQFGRAAAESDVFFLINNTDQPGSPKIDAFSIQAVNSEGDTVGDPANIEMVNTAPKLVIDRTWNRTGGSTLSSREMYGYVFSLSDLGLSGNTTVTGFRLTTTGLDAAVIGLAAVSGGTTPLEGYDLWASLNGVGAATNDFDSDGLSNLAEYAMDGNPKNASDQGTPPRLLKSGDLYVYLCTKRSDDEALIYSVETSTDLLDPNAWMASGTTEIGTHVSGGLLNLVTNRVDEFVGNTYIRLKIEREN